MENLFGIVSDEEEEETWKERSGGWGVGSAETGSAVWFKYLPF